IYTSTGKNPGSRGKRDIYWVDAGFIQTFKANDYFGREPPGLEPEIFAPGIISTGKHEGCFSFSRDGRLFIFARSGVIFIMEQKDGTWGSPKRAPFGMPSYDGDFLLAPDGKTLYLASNRPVTKEGPPPGYANIWEVKRTATGWSEPRHLQPPVNVNRHSSYPCLTAGRTLYFFSKHRKDSFGKGDIYRAPLSNGKYTRVENLGETINTAYEEVDPFIAADESYLIFSSNRPGGYGKDDLYISFRKNNGPGSWTEPINMGKEINSSTNEWMPYVTPDGKYFFFTTRKRAHLPPGIKKTIADPPGNGSRDIYWVSAGIIEKFKE
ncbi:MAG: hypothetical protein GY950_08865, partial [bacterium]|nr:hypothetical protein [bacterium]